MSDIGYGYAHRRIWDERKKEKENNKNSTEERIKKLEKEIEELKENK